MTRAVATILISLVLSLLCLVTNINYRQKTQYLEGMKGEKTGNFMVALTGYESAIRMYLPFSSRIELSAQRIWQLAETSELHGDTERALIAYRSLRSAFYAVRWLQQPGESWISRCDSKIAVLAALRKGKNQ